MGQFFRTLLGRSGAGGSSPFGAYTHWRFRSEWQISTIQLTALLFRDGAGNAIDTSAATPIASGTSSGSLANLFDGDDTTAWVSDAGGQFAWVGCQFPAPVAVMGMALQRKTGQSTLERGRIEASNDGVVWKEIVWIEIGTLTVDVPKWFDFNNALPSNGTDFGAHTHWRVFSPGPILISIAEILFKDNAGTAISTAGVTALGTSADTHTPDKAFDGDNSTWWNSAFFSNTPFPYQWVGCQFPTAERVMQMAIQRTASQSQRLPNHAAFQYSDDGAVWATACWANFDNGIANDTPDWYNFANAIPVNAGTDFGAHKHWKVQTFIGTLFNSFGNLFDIGWCAFAEIAFKDAAGASISLSGITARASGGTAANAFDGNVSTLWEGENSTTLPWVSAEFPSDVTVMQVMLERNATQDESSHPNEPREVQFMWSNNRKEWVNVGTALTAPMVNSTPKWFDLAGAL